MSKSSGLILFQQAVEELEAKGKQEDIEKWVRNNRDLFYKLSSAYMKKRGMEKALMAYIIERSIICVVREPETRLHFRWNGLYRIILSTAAKMHSMPCMLADSLNT
ncbi:hypothetical protein M5E86_08555 [Blautia wexlerae]|nr:hypothetical protein M5E86_08555 [Blautia wexlerae]